MTRPLDRCWPPGAHRTDPTVPRRGHEPASPGRDRPWRTHAHRPLPRARPGASAGPQDSRAHTPAARNVNEIQRHDRELPPRKRAGVLRVWGRAAVALWGRHAEGAVPLRPRSTARSECAGGRVVSGGRAPSRTDRRGCRPGEVVPSQGGPTSYSLRVPFQVQPWLGQTAGRLSTSLRAALSGKAWGESARG